MRSKRVQPILVLLFITTLSVVTACQTSPPPSTVTSIGSPPGSHPNFSQTLGETKCAIYADMLVLPFEEAILEADLVVKLSIEQALEELDSPTHKTLYEASVLNVVKGDKELTTSMCYKQETVNAHLMTTHYLCQSSSTISFSIKLRGTIQ